MPRFQSSPPLPSYWPPPSSGRARGSERGAVRHSRGHRSLQRSERRLRHHAGDEVLRQLAELFRDALCAGELTCRYGGEEFAFVLVNSDEAQALATAERLRALVEARTFWASDLSGQSVPLNVTLSLGYASFGRGAETCAELVARADQALYAAKGSGRNCVMSSGRALRDPSASSERVRAR